MSVASADEPLTVFGIKMGDDVRKYKWMGNYTIYTDVNIQNFFIQAPKPNSNFDQYMVWTSCGDNKIYAIEASHSHKRLKKASKVYGDLRNALVNKYGNENNIVDSKDEVTGYPLVIITIPSYEILLYETRRTDENDEEYSLLNVSYSDTRMFNRNCDTDKSGL